MINQVQKEFIVRGNNKWSVYSALTNYSSHGGDEDFAPLKNTKADTKAIRMFDREFKVSKWIDTEDFNRLAA